MNDVSDQDELMDAVQRLMLSEPGLTAKNVHKKLVEDAAWADASVSEVKKACSKVAKTRAYWCSSVCDCCKFRRSR